MKLKKHFSLLLAASVLCGSCILPQTAAAEPLIWGDVDESGEVDVSDAVLLSRYYAEDWSAVVSASGKQAADVNRDERINDADITQILCYVAKLCDELGVPEEWNESSYNAVNLIKDIPVQDVSGKNTDAAFRNSQLALTADLMQDIIKNQEAPENLMISPLSISLALAMTANGANGNTKAEMESVLGGELTMDSLNPYYKSYAENLPDSPQSSLKIANSIWIRNDENRIKVPDAFLQTTANYYKADVFRAPFDDSTVTDVNNWVNYHTHAMIPKLIESVDPYEVMYLINALAFEAEWMQPYAKEETGEGKFTLENGETVTAEMMYSEEYQYISDAKSTGFIKNYAGNGYSFAAILPNAGISVEEYLSGMTAESVSALLAGRSNESVHAAMPKFSFDYSIKLNDTLTRLGMPTAFSDVADFSALNAVADNPLHIGLVLHKTHITVDERGTKAGAVTLVAMDECTAVAEPPKTVRLDRPFVFMIVDEKAKLPVFIGCVLDPTA